MDWRSAFESKLVTAEAAVSTISCGDRIYISSNCAEPQHLVDALVGREDLRDIEILHLLTMGRAPYADEKFKERFRHRAFFIGPNVRAAVNEGRADYVPIFLSDIPRLFRSGAETIDACLIHVSQPDSHGYVSMGVSVDVGRAAVDCVRKVIAQVNRRMPRTHGNTALHVTKLDAIVEFDEELAELARPARTEVSDAIGKHLASLVQDGSTLQVGIGAIPESFLAELSNKNDLGVHTEMFSDGLIPLLESGVINGSRKTHIPGKVVTTFVMGTRRLFDFVDDNPSVEFHASEMVNDPFVIARNPKVVAVNSAIEVDITGQVVSDSIGELFYSGIGGQVDFIRGAARSPGGKPIIALPSTATDASGSKCSRIVPCIRHGAGVVTSRGDVHYVVTEHGIAYLHGKSVRERAEALMQIAHPQFRDELKSAAKRRRLIG